MGLIKVSGLGDKGLGEERQDMIQGGHKRRGGPHCFCLHLARLTPERGI